MHRMLPCLLALAACTGIQETRIYAGPQRPISGTCNPPGRASLTRRGQAIILSPNDGTLALQGAIEGTALSASTTLTGVDKHPYPLTFTGQLAGDHISGTLSTPSCRYGLELTLNGD